MLLNFSIENYKNFKNKHTFYLTGSEKNDINIFKKNNIKILSSIAIFGENGSGKSNLLKALFFIKDFIIRPPIASTPISQVANDVFLLPFKLDEEYINKPSKFEVELLIKDINYKYSFAVDNNSVYSEELKVQDNKTKFYKYIYKRNKEIKFNEKFDLARKIKEKVKNDLDKLGQNRLFLSLLSSLNIEIAVDIFIFFATKLFIFPQVFNGGQIDGLATLAKLLENKDNNKEKLIDFLNAVDINIDDIKINTKEIDSKNINLITNQILDSKLSINSIIFERENKQFNKVLFDLYTEESDGTKKLFNLMGDLINALENGLTIFFDELDKSLHSDLLIYIIKLFNNQEINKNGAQIIFTAHNTNILNNKYKDLFTREQVYILDKKNTGESELYSLLAIKGVQKNLSKEDIYNEGLIGGKPYTKGFNL